MTHSPAIAQLLAAVEQRKESIMADHMSLSAIPAVNPRAGGTGEAGRIAWLEARLAERHIPYELFRVPDAAVAEGERRSLIALYPGAQNGGPRLWFIAHVDTVNCGDPQLWQSDPFTPHREGDIIRCLGAEDNTQAVICGLHLLELLYEFDIKPQAQLGFIFAADEETGSAYGLEAMKERGLFSPGDEAIIPDSGNGEGSFIEIAEKGVLWLEFSVLGRQAHGSRPQTGINAASAAARLGVALEDTLRRTYDAADDTFRPAGSTFELTQVFAAGQSVNMIPAEARFCMDCRVLPCYELAGVLADIQSIAREQQAASGAEISWRVLQQTPAAPPTPREAPVVRTLLEALREQGIQAEAGGIGGSTCAAILRSAGAPSVVWSTINGMAHKPDEYTSAHNMLQDMQVFVRTLLSYPAGR